MIQSGLQSSVLAQRCIVYFTAVALNSIGSHVLDSALGRDSYFRRTTALLDVRRCTILDTVWRFPNFVAKRMFSELIR